MASERRRAPLTAGIEGLASVEGGSFELESPLSPAYTARLARSAVEMAAACAGAAVIITRERRAGAALRGSREVGVEARLLAPRPADGIAARTPLTLPLQGDPAGPAFASAAAFIAAFVAGQAVGTGDAAEASMRATLVGAITKARKGAAVGLDLAAVAKQAAAALGAAHPKRAKVEGAFALLEAAELAAQACGSPVEWSALLAPSPSGRRAAVFLDLSALPAAAAPLVEGLALSALAAAWPGAAEALSGGPLVLVADAPSTPLARFACQRIAQAAGAPASNLLALFLAPAPGSPRLGLPPARVDLENLRFPARDWALPLAIQGAEPAELTADERDALSKPALRARLLGEAVGDQSEADDDDLFSPAATPGAAAGRESSEALQAAAGDLSVIARKRRGPAPPSSAGKTGAYEASDFELK